MTLPWLSLFGGLSILGVGVLAMVRIDQYWVARHLGCETCEVAWFGTEKVCEGCGQRAEERDLTAGAEVSAVRVVAVVESSPAVSDVRGAA